MRKFKIIEYCTGDFGDLGSHIGEIDAENQVEAKEKFKQQNNIKDSEIGFYGFNEIKLKQNCKVRNIFDIDKAVEDFKKQMREQGFKVDVIIEGYEKDR